MSRLASRAAADARLSYSFFALAQAQLQLDAPLFKVKRERHQRVALQLDLLPQTADLRLVCQQTPRTARVLVEDVALLIGG